MSFTGIALIIIAVAVCILVPMLISTLLTVKRAAASIGELAETVQKELKPTLQELTAVLADQRAIVRDVAEHSDDVTRFMSALGETGNNLHSINRAVGAVTSVINTSAVWVTGAKVAGKYMLERYLKKRGGI